MLPRGPTNVAQRELPGLRWGGAAIRLQILISDLSGSGTTSVYIAAIGAAFPGSIKRYQLLYADTSAAACGGGFNLSNALEVVWSA